MTPTPEIAEYLEQLVQRERERERAAALVRAFAEHRPAGEVPELLRLARMIEAGARYVSPAPPPVRTCAVCGNPENDHPYRHPFRAR